jgi:hypothetical protein
MLVSNWLKLKKFPKKLNHTNDLLIGTNNGQIKKKWGIFVQDITNIIIEKRPDKTTDRLFKIGQSAFSVSVHNDVLWSCLLYNKKKLNHTNDLLIGTNNVCYFI